MSHPPSDIRSLPIRRDLRALFIVSLLIAGLVATVSVVGLLSSSGTYPTEALQQTFIPNDVVILFVGLPILVVSFWRAWHGSLIGLLCWPGALCYMLYNYVAYVYAVPFGWMLLLYISLAVMCAYALVGLMIAIDGRVVRERLGGALPEKAIGAVIAGMGLLFLLRMIGVMVTAIVGSAAMPRTEIAVNLSDATIAPAWIIGGVVLWRRQEVGYAGALGLLVQGSMLFVSLVAWLVLQPVLTAGSLSVIDIVVVLAMGMICFVPCAMFMRAILRTHA